MSTPSTVSSAAAGLRAGDTRSVDLVDAALQRAAMTEAELHAYLTIDRENARHQAEAADAAFAAGEDAGPLQGIPIALKDNMVTRGVETTCSSKMLSGYIPPYDATVVRKLKAAGAVLVGKTNLDEFAMGSSTENSAYGLTHNPWDTGRVPGGSSGGSAAVVAAGSALAALGSDTGGSIRQPASLCGVVGFKPTYGLVSRYGLIAFASSLDQIGPLTRTVEDALVVYEAIAGHDPLDATSYRGDMPDVRAQWDGGLDGLRVGVITEISDEGIQPDVLDAFRTTVDRMAAAGAKVDEVSIPAAGYALSAYYLIAPAECSANLARFDGVRYGLREEGETVEEMMSKTRAEGFGPEVIRRILLGTYALSAGYYDAFYGQAQRVRTLLRDELAAAYANFDILVSPSSPDTAFEIGAKTSDPLSMYRSDMCTIPSNLSGDPGISVPVALDRSGLPIGFQVMAPALGEPVMFRAARGVETVADFSAVPPMVEAL
ncbi:MAG: Asp-tRNA(Asn)/Glu-tRNA(Gln) amidotransferase subunit GatA [Acidimicrobiia bacterium]|nr:Asp-tRNA(Asn)/Glu-tRNA(Gln) amidotransferase subunit GatA [Acidimicrobiia bacterium]